MDDDVMAAAERTPFMEAATCASEAAKSSVQARTPEDETFTVQSIAQTCAPSKNVIETAPSHISNTLVMWGSEACLPSEDSGKLVVQTLEAATRMPGDAMGTAEGTSFMQAATCAPEAAKSAVQAEAIVQASFISEELFVETQISEQHKTHAVEAAEPIDVVQTLDATLSSQLPVLPVLASLAVSLLLIITIVVIRRRGTSSKRSQILLTGPSDAGKTAIHSTLVFGKTLPSHTSLQTNTSAVTLPNSTRPVTLVDIPGHPRIRDQFRAHLGKAKAIVFVVDASTIARQGAAVAEHLHHILHAITSLPPTQNPPPLVILAHKHDLLASSPSSGAPLAVARVRAILERELEKRRGTVTRLGDDDDVMGGLTCTRIPFDFENWEGGEIDILGSCVGVMTEAGRTDSEKASEDGLAELKEWLEDLE